MGLLQVAGFPKFPKTKGTCFGAPTIRIIVFCHLYWGPPVKGNYRIYICVYIYIHIFAPPLRPKSLNLMHYIPSFCTYKSPSNPLYSLALSLVLRLLILWDSFMFLL